MSNLVNGERIKAVRELHKLTQKDLSELIGVRQPTLAQIEARLHQPGERVVEALSLRTGFPPEFFRQPSTVHFPLGSLLLRARASITAAERSQAHRFGEIIFEVADRLANKVTGWEPRLPRLEEPAPIAAAMTRAALGYSPTAPVRNLTRLLELQGVLVIAVPVDLENRDAYAVWAGRDARRPVIVITGTPLGDRLRWSIAHELAHLVLFPHGTIADMERQANAFAAEFLLPEEAMRQELLPPLTLAALAKLKPRWRVSIQALAMRARDLGIVTERQHRYLFEQITKRGWRLREPEHLDITFERPRALRQMAELVYGDPIDYQRFATDMRLSPGFLRSVIEAKAPAPTEARLDDGPERTNLVQFPEPRQKHRARTREERDHA